VALRRSLAVTAAARNGGCGRRLVESAETHARNSGARHVYLLTSTAQAFFERLGYVVANRNTAPGAIRETREFATVRTETTVLMWKALQGSSGGMEATDTSLAPQGGERG